MESHTTAIPDPVAAGKVLATLDPTQAALFVMIFVIVALMAFIVWRELNLGSMIRTLNKMTEAMYALRLTLIEDRILGREDAARRKVERKEERQEERQENREDRDGRSSS